jgi:hypothetical protein
METYNLVNVSFSPSWIILSRRKAVFISRHKERGTSNQCLILYHRNFIRYYCKMLNG